MMYWYNEHLLLPEQMKPDPDYSWFYHFPTADNPSVEGVQGSLGAFDGYSDSRYVGNVLTIDNVRLIYE